MNAVVKILSFFLLTLCYCLESLVLTFIPKKLRSKDVRGEIVLITGAGSGIGRQLALRFARLGSRIVLWDINERGAEETAQMIRQEGGDVHSYQCDVSQRQAVYAAAAKVKAEVGQVSILVNNAGIVTGKRFLECPDHMIEKTFQVNALAHFWTCKAFLPYMIEANYGHLVSIASIAGLAGGPRLTDYCASKYAAVGFEESLRMELRVEGHTGIKSTVVCPYHVDTGMFQGFKTKLVKTLTPEYLVDQIVSAVLVEQAVLIVPSQLGILLVLKSEDLEELKETAALSRKIEKQIEAMNESNWLKAQKRTACKAKLPDASHCSKKECVVKKKDKKVKKVRKVSVRAALRKK